MLRVFVSSTFRDLKRERETLLDELKQTLTVVGMEDFIPDGRTSHDICIGELRNSDVVIFLISPHYGTFLDDCKIEGCKADCPMKGEYIKDRISYTHCEYKVALAEEKPHQVYLVDKGDNGWDRIHELKGWKEKGKSVNWKEVRENGVFDELSDDAIEHYFEVAEAVGEFKKEVEHEFCPKIKDIGVITHHLANNLVKWHSEGRINLKDFCGRRKELYDLLERMNESVEVYGVGGIGKTTLIHVALLIQRLRGGRIVTIGTRQSYVTGSGYAYFREKFKDDQHGIIGDNITLDDVIDALSLPDEVRTQEEGEKIRTITDTIEKEKITLFIDDFQLADRGVKELVKSARGVVLSSKTRTGIARNELPLSGIDEQDRGGLIDLIAGRLSKTISDVSKEKIKKIAEGHPVSTEILVRNCDRIDFRKLENYKSGLDLSRDDDAEEFMKRVVKEILSEGAFRLLRNLSVINTDLGNKLDRAAIEQTYKGYAATDFNKIFAELIDTDMLKKIAGAEGIYQFSYRHIKAAVSGEKDEESHERAVEYYTNKKHFGVNYYIYDDIEDLFHRSKLNPDKKWIDVFIKIYNYIKPEIYLFERAIAANRLIDVGEELKNCFEGEDKARVSSTLGNLYMTFNRFEDAENAYKEVLEIYKKRGGESPDVHLPEFAAAQNDLKSLYSHLSRLKYIGGELKEISELCTKLADKDPNIYLPKLANTLYKLGMVYCELNRLEDMEGAFKKVLEMADKYPDIYLPSLAHAQFNLGLFYMSVDRIEEGLNNFKNVLKQRDLSPNLLPDALYQISEKYISQMEDQKESD